MNIRLCTLPRTQQGLSLATALFVITVLAVLAAISLQLVRSNAESTQEGIRLVRSLYAAESGVQMMLNTVFPPDGMNANCPAGTTTYSMAEDGLNACSAQVTCAALPVNGETYYTVTSKGTCGSVSRTVQVRAQ